MFPEIVLNFPARSIVTFLKLTARSRSTRKVAHPSEPKSHATDRHCCRINVRPGCGRGRRKERKKFRPRLWQQQRRCKFPGAELKCFGKGKCNLIVYRIETDEVGGQFQWK